MTAAILVFFVLAAVGMLCGVPVFVCAWRALAGAAAAFVAITVVGRVLNWITVDTIVKSIQQTKKTGEGRSEHRK